jgi:hypothetical protein
VNRPFDTIAGYPAAQALDERIHGAHYRATKQLSAQLSAAENRIRELQVLPSGHAGRAQLSALYAERDGIKVQLAGLEAAHNADVTARSSAARAAIALLEAKQALLKIVIDKLAATGWLPAGHPALAARPALEAQRDALNAEISALEIPPYDFPP